MDKQLYINDQLVDLNDVEIPLVLQVNDLNNLQSLQGNYTKQFKLPLTQNNRAILGFPDEIPITTNLPYEQLSAKLIVDGMEIISNGICEIIDVQDDYASVTILSGNIDFLDLLGGQVYDMGDSTTIWSHYGKRLVWNQYSLPVPGNLADLANCVWDVPHAAYSQKKTSGWIWPIVNYGDIDVTPPFVGHINVRNQRPGFFLHTAIELLVQSTGYRIDYKKSSLVNDPLYQKLIIQFSNSSFEHGADYQNAPDNLGASYSKNIDQVIGNLPRVGIVTSSDIYQNGFPFEGVVTFGPSDHYIVAKNVNFTATLIFDIYVKGRMTGKPLEVDIKFVVINTDGTFTDFAAVSISMNQNYNRLSGEGADIVGEQTFLNQKLSQDFSLVAGQQLYVKYHVNNIGSSDDSTYAIIRNGATLNIVTSEQLVLWQSAIQCERILPDVSQLDLLKDTLQHFGMLLIANPNTATLIFVSFKDIIANIPNAVDWSLKAVDVGKQITFKLGSYSQVNWMRYQLDSAIPLNLMPKYFADDHIDISDKTLNPTVPIADLFISIFGPSLNSPYLGGSIAQISNPTVTDEFSVGDEPRLLVDQKLNLLQAGLGGSSISVIFSDGDPGFEYVTIPINDIISVPYFYKPGGEYNLCYCDKNGQQGLRSKYYPEIQKILNQAKAVARYFYLTPLDILELDYTIPVYVRQDGCYYYISKIDSWIKGKPTKVYLVKLS